MKSFSENNLGKKIHCYNNDTNNNFLFIAELYVKSCKNETVLFSDSIISSQEDLFVIAGMQ